jgi:putative FmdB family regulatory protein
MPTYEYVCTKCGQHVEVFQRLSEDPLTTCGVCSGPLRKVFHPAGIVFKGSGFYATDNRSAAKAGRAETASGSKSETSGGSSGEGTGGKKPVAEKAPSGKAKEKSA